MQNKKLLSVCLTVLLVCICLVGVFSLSVSAVTPVTWKVTGTNNAAAGEYATLQEAIDAAAAKTDWLGTDELTIEIATSTKQSFDYENGLLFEVNTIFTQANTKLPIIIKGGEISVSHVPTGSDAGLHTLIACSNDYTFKNVKMLIGDKNIEFYAGSGEVVFEDSTIYSGSNHRARFYGDNFTASAFAGWTQANVDAEKGEDGLIPVSLTFRRTNYPSADKSRFSAMTCKEDFAASGDLVSADDLNVGLTFEDSSFGTGYLRRADETDFQSSSPVGKITFNMIDTSSDNSKAIVRCLYPIGKGDKAGATNSTPIELPDFDVEINIEGGNIQNTNANYMNNRLFFIAGVKFNGNVDINISGGKFPTGATYLLNKAHINGDVSFDLADCTLGSTVCLTYGDDVSSDAVTTDVVGNVNVNITQCNFPGKTYLFYGTTVKGDALVNIAGGTYGTELNVSEGDKSTRAAGNVITNVTGGTFGILRGSFHAGRGIEEGHGFRNEMTLSNCTITTYQGSRQCPGETGKLINNVLAGTKITAFWGAYYSASAGGGNYGYVENNVSGGEITTFNGGGQLKAGYTTDLVNNITGGTIGTFVGAGNADVVGTLTNNITGGTIGKYIGTTDGMRNDEVINIVYNNMNGGTITGNFYGTGNQPSGEVYNKFDGAEIKGAYYGAYGDADFVENQFLSGKVAKAVYGTAEGTFANATNYIKGGNYCSSTKSSSRQYFVGSSGTITGTLTNIIDGNATVSDNTYLARGVVNKVVSHYHKGAFTKTVYGPDCQFDTVENHYYGTYEAKIAHHSVAGSTSAVPADQQRLVTNYIYPGAKFTTFYGGDHKDDHVVGVAKIVNNVDGASFNNFYGVGFRGVVYEVENNITGNANFGTYCGGYSLGMRNKSAVPGIISAKITNNIQSGTFANYYGGNAESHRDYTNDTIINNIYGGTFNDSIFMGSGKFNAIKEGEEGYVPGTVDKSGGWGDQEIINNIYGGTFNTRVYGTGAKGVSCETVTNTLEGGDFIGSFSGTYGAADLVTNNVRGGTYDLAGSPRNYYFGTDGSFNTNKVVNNVDGNAVFVDNWYGSNGPSNLVENHFYSIGKHTNLYGDQGVTRLVQNYFHDGFKAFAVIRGNRGTGTRLAAGEKRVVENYFYNCDFSATGFRGADGGEKAFPTTSKITNYVMGGVYKEFVAGTGRGDVNEIYNVITGDATFTKYYGGSTSYFNDGADNDTHLEAVFTTTVGTESEPFTGSIGTFYGGNITNGTLDTRAIITNVINGGTFGSFYGGSAAGIDASVTTTVNAGTFNNRFYGTAVECGIVTNNLNGGDFIASFTGNTGTADQVINNINGGTYDVSGGTRNYFYGTGGAANKVVNTLNGDAVFVDNWYGTHASAKLVENHYYSIGDHTSAYGDWGLSELVQNYFHDGFVAHATIRGNRSTGAALAEGEKREVENYFYDCDFSGATFVGIDGVEKAFPTVSKITNYVMGGVHKEITAGGGRGDANEINTVITGDAEITTFYGGSVSLFDDGADTHFVPVYTNTVGTETDPFTGSIGTFYGGNKTSSRLDTYAVITNTVNGGTIGKFIGGSAAGFDTSVTNVINSGTFEGIVHGGANDATVGGAASVEGAVDVTINGGLFGGKVSTVPGGTLKVSGTIGVGSEGQIVGTEGSDITLVQHEEWITGHKYLMLPDSALEQVVILNNDASVNGQGVADFIVDAVVGFSVPQGGVMASLSLEEKMVVKIWFPKSDVDTYLEMFGKPFEYEAILDDNGTPVTLAKGNFNAPRKADVTYGGAEYYLVSLNGIGAGSFNKTFTVTGSSMAFSNSVLNLASDGIKAYAGQDVEPLFQAIYDYGASACGLDTRYDHLPYSTELPASVVNKADNAVVNFSEVTALMGDAIGLRFVGTAGANFDPAAIVVKLDGAALVNGTDYRIVNEAGNVCVDIYFKAAFMSTDMTVTIEAGGVTAFNYQTSVERTVADIVRLAPRNEKAITLLVYIQQVKAYLA